MWKTATPAIIDAKAWDMVQGELELLDTEWSDIRFPAIVDRITVHNDGRLVFIFTNGSEETVMM